VFLVGEASTDGVIGRHRERDSVIGPFAFQRLDEDQSCTVLMVEAIGGILV
jgi:hypothetical protein